MSNSTHTIIISEKKIEHNYCLSSYAGYEGSNLASLLFAFNGGSLFICHTDHQKSEILSAMTHTCFLKGASLSENEDADIVCKEYKDGSICASVVVSVDSLDRLLKSNSEVDFEEFLHNGRYVIPLLVYCEQIEHSLNQIVVDMVKVFVLSNNVKSFEPSSIDEVICEIESEEFKSTLSQSAVLLVDRLFYSKENLMEKFKAFRKSPLYELYGKFETKSEGWRHIDLLDFYNDKSNQKLEFYHPIGVLLLKQLDEKYPLTFFASFLGFVPMDEAKNNKNCQTFLSDKEACAILDSYAQENMSSITSLACSLNKHTDKALLVGMQKQDKLRLTAFLHILYCIRNIFY